MFVGVKKLLTHVWSRWFVQVYFGTHHARMYLTANLLKQTCAGGASMLTRKSVLETVGGLGHFGQYLAEDFFLAKNIAEWVAAHVDMSVTGTGQLIVLATAAPGFSTHLIEAQFAKTSEFTCDTISHPCL